MKQFDFVAISIVLILLSFFACYVIRVNLPLIGHFKRIKPEQRLSGHCYDDFSTFVIRVGASWACFIILMYSIMGLTSIYLNRFNLLPNGYYSVFNFVIGLILLVFSLLSIYHHRQFVKDAIEVDGDIVTCMRINKNVALVMLPISFSILIS